MTSPSQTYAGVDPEFSSALRDRAETFNADLTHIMESVDIDPQVRDILDYAMDSPGKRIRSVLVLWTCEMVSRRPATADALTAAAAIEMVHTYSLIHDDLPAMDDDDYRRGRLTCHKVFDEGMAILAGDALLTLAFEILADRIESASLGVALVKSLARAAGPAGMIAGQVADLKAENTAGTLDDLRAIHLNKTAKMFQCAAHMGALCGRADPDQLHRLSEYGLKIGLGFQIADDILDVSASSEQLGKTAGKDEKAGKMTYPALMGIAPAQDLARQLAADAVDRLKPFGPQARLLRQLAQALLQRKK